VTHPVDSATDLVIDPVSTLGDTATQQAVRASGRRRRRTSRRVGDELRGCTHEGYGRDPAQVASGDYGPVR